MKKISILGVLVGGIVDIVSTNVFAVPLFFFAMTRVDWAHTAKEQMTAAVMDAMRTTPSLMVAGFFVGIAGSMLGGYVAALIAKRDETINGACSAWLCVTIGIVGWVMGGDGAPVLYRLSAFVLSPAAGALGGYVRVLQREFASDKLHASG